MKNIFLFIASNALYLSHIIYPQYHFQTGYAVVPLALGNWDSFKRSGLCLCESNKYHIRCLWVIVHHIFKKFDKEDKHFINITNKQTII